MITPHDFKSSALVAGFPSSLRVARVPLAAIDGYRELLGEAELAAARAFEGRRELEFVAGRIAARIALAQLVGPAAADAVIDRDADGAPRMQGLVDPPIVSISHTRDHAVAVVGHASCVGIDLCAHADVMRVRRVVIRFVASDEVALVDGGGVARWTALWALKEAGAKALRRGLLDGGLRATHLTSIDPPRFDWPTLDAVVVTGRDDTMAVAYKL